MRSVMTHQFKNAPQANIPRAAFNRSHGRKMTMEQAGYLWPVYADEALPGDTFRLRMSALCRMATPINPIMDNLFLDTFFFFVPNRLIWDNWQKFCGEQDNPGDSIDYTIPQMSSVTGYTNLGLSDYLGIPTGVPGLSHSSLWHRAYNLIYNEWFRNQNIQNSVVVDKDDGPDDPADYGPIQRCKRHDYFTSCLPWPQKGDAVTLPLGTEAPVLGIGHDATVTYNRTTVAGLRETGQYPTNATYAVAHRLDDMSSNTFVEEDPNQEDWPYIRADLTEATNITINELRQAFQIQRLQERDARGGTRYTEIIRSHFGVVSPDARLQRPEYLGGGTTPLHVHSVAQTSSTDATTPQGNLSSFVTASVNNNGFTKSFTEHGVLLGLAMVRADVTYQQGLPRMFDRKTRYDYYWPALSHIGEQAVKNKELFAQGSADAVADEATFGYQERHAEYRYKQSEICGILRSEHASSLDVWHLSQDFTTLPTLNDTFIKETPPISRVIAVPSEPHFILDAYFDLNCVRPMPLYGVPGLIDHF